MHMYKKNVVFLAGCLFMTVLLFMGCGTDRSLTFSTQSSEEIGQETEADAKAVTVEAAAQQVQAESETAQSSVTGQEAQSSDSPLEPACIYIQVNGAVKYPGVYQLPAGARVFEAVELAGGMTQEAAAEAVNQALTLTDGEMITIYTQSEWEKMQTLEAPGEAAAFADRQAAQQDDGKININTADKDMLCTIPGVGQTRAESILAYRQEHGAFSSIDDIKNVSGIKEGLFKKIKDKIKV